MVAELKPTGLPWIMEPQLPPRYTINAFGFRLNKDGSHRLTEAGLRHGPVAQHVLAASFLRLGSREQIAARYGLCTRQVQEIVTGTAQGYMTAPVRERLHELGIGGSDARGYRGNAHTRLTEIREAQAAVAAQAALAMRFPDRFTESEIQQVAADLYLLSGAWREQKA